MVNGKIHSSKSPLNFEDLLIIAEQSKSAGNLDGHINWLNTALETAKTEDMNPSSISSLMYVFSYPLLSKSRQAYYTLYLKSLLTLNKGGEGTSRGGPSNLKS